MDYKLLWVIIAVISAGSCASVDNAIPQKAPTKSLVREVIACGINRDVACFLDKAEALLEEKKTALLAQADIEVLKATGRADDQENAPSQLSKAINRIISELTEMFKDGLSGFFKSAREAEEEETEEESETQKATKSRANPHVGEARKKKKKKKLLGLIKLIIIGLVLKAKLTLLLKALSAALQLKFFLVAVAGLILNAARFYLDLKKGHQPQKVIYYEHAQHQHHYEGGDEEWSSGPGGGYWGRSYDVEGEESPQDLAYSKQKPVKTDNNNNKPSFSWFG